MCPVFIEIGSCPGIATRLPLEDFTILIVKWNASATACITSASAHVSLTLVTY